MRSFLYTFVFLLVPVGGISQTRDIDSDYDITRQLEEYIDFRASYDRFSGVTAIFENQEPVFVTDYGLADRSWGISNKPDTKFDLASATKMFTATAIAILVESDLVQFNDPFIDYFPDFPIKEASGITIRQLLSHRSGISDFFFNDNYLHCDRSRLRNLDDYDIFFNYLKVNPVPEGAMVYSNTNFVLLGRMIEHVTGQSYYEFVQQNIFAPLEMAGTGFYEMDLVVPNVAQGYYRDPQAAVEFGVPNDGQLRSNSGIQAIKGTPAGGAYSTVQDMNRFFKGLRSGKIISDEMITQLMAVNDRGYTLGFQSYNQQGVQVWGHSGGFYGVSVMAFHLPAHQQTFICLANNDFGAPPVFDRYLSLLSGTSVYVPILRKNVSYAEFEGYYEVYEGEMKGRQLQIQSNSDRLIFDKHLEFFTYDNDSFFDIDNDQFFLHFERDENDHIIGFTRGDGGGFLQKARKISAAEIKKMETIDLSVEQLQNYLVRLQFQEGGMMPGHIPLIEVDGGGLVVDNMMKFLPYEKDKFFLADDTGMKLMFDRNVNGEITGAEVLREKEVVGILKRIKE